MINKTFQEFIDEMFGIFSIEDLKGLGAKSSNISLEFLNSPNKQKALESFIKLSSASENIKISNSSLKRNLTNIADSQYRNLFLENLANYSIAEAVAISGRSISQILLRYTNCNSRSKDVIGSCTESLSRALYYYQINNKDAGLNFLLLCSLITIPKIVNKGMERTRLNAPIDNIKNLFFRGIEYFFGNSSRHLNDFEGLNKAGFFLILNQITYIIGLYSFYSYQAAFEERMQRANNSDSDLTSMGNKERDYPLSLESRFASICYTSAISSLFLLVSEFAINKTSHEINMQNINARRLAQMILYLVPNFISNIAELTINNNFSRRLNPQENPQENPQQNPQQNPWANRQQITNRGLVNRSLINNRSQLNPLALSISQYPNQINFINSPRPSARSIAQILHSHESHDLIQNDENQQSRGVNPVSRHSRSRSLDNARITSNSFVNVARSRSQDNQRLP